jgi:UPF0755 protein
MAVNEKKRVTPGRIVWILINFLVLCILLALAFGAGMGAGVYYAVTPAGSGDPVRFDVAKGTPAREVAEKLEHCGLIRSTLLFRIALVVTKSERHIKPGSYLIDPKSTMMEVLTQLKKGDYKLRLVTVPEGLVLKEVALVMEKNGVAKVQEIIDASMDRHYMIEGKKLASLEGYLLPDTYDIPRDYGAGEVLDTMVKAFERSVVPVYETRKNSLPCRLSLHQVVTLASMVEREAQVPSERPVIAMVYYNRLKKHMKMECDATIQFALGKQKMILKYSDLRVASPYNTYLHKGLPPGPIANPGLECIRAALNPSPCDYLFYVRNDVKNDGSHIFSRTFQEHNEAIRNYQK